MCLLVISSFFLAGETVEFPPGEYRIYTTTPTNCPLPPDDILVDYDGTGEVSGSPRVGADVLGVLGLVGVLIAHLSARLGIEI